MLYVNDVEVKKGENKKYDAFLQNVLPRLPEVVVFKRPHPPKKNATGLNEPDPLVSVPLEAISYDEEMGSQHWRYCTSAPTKNERGKWIYKPHSMRIRRYLNVNKKQQPDLIFFMMELCHKVKDHTFVLEDKRGEALKVIEEDDQSVAVKYMIYNSLSPLSPENTGSEDLLRMIASSWEVSQAHDKRRSLPEIRVELFQKIHETEKKDGVKRGFKTFLEEIKTKERIVLRANIQRAVDSHTIGYDPRTFTWRYLPNGPIITTVAARFFDSPANGLFDYFIRNEDKRIIFFNTLEDKYEFEEDLIDKSEMEDEEPQDEMGMMKEAFLTGKMSYHDKQKFGGKLGLKVFGVNETQLTEDIQGKLATDKQLQEH